MYQVIAKQYVKFVPGNNLNFFQFDNQFFDIGERIAHNILFSSLFRTPERSS